MVTKVIIFNWDKKNTCFQYAVVKSWVEQISLIIKCLTPSVLPVIIQWCWQDQDIELVIWKIINYY